MSWRKLRKKRQDKRIFTSKSVTGIRNITVPAEMSFDRKIGPVLDTDAYDMLYAERPGQLQRYQRGLKKIVGNERTATGNTMVYNTEHMTQQQGSEELWTTNPVTLFNMSKINITSEDKNTVANSIGRLTVVLSTIGLIATSAKRPQITIIVGIIIALIFMTSFNITEKFVPNVLDKTPLQYHKYQPRDLYGSELNMKRQLLTGQQTQKFGPKRLGSSIVKYA